MPPNFVAVRKSDIFGDDWSSVDDPYEDERKQWLKDNPEPDAPTMGKKDSWQTRLPNFDPSMDDPIWGPSVAMRVQGDYPAGSPVRQGAANLGYEEMLDIHSEHPKKDKTLPDDDDPTWDPDVESEWERDPESGSRYYYDSSGQKVFLDLEEGMKGSWLARPTRKDASNLYAHTGDPRKLVFVRRNALLGTQMKRDSDQNPEGVAEMFLQHDENLPKEGLATIPLRGRSYQHAAAGLGLPDHTDGINRELNLAGQEEGWKSLEELPSDFVQDSWSNPSRWSDALLPWQKPEEEDEDWHKVMQGEPMDIAFRFLKMSADEADELEEQMLSDMERGTSNPRTRRKQRSMGERESKASIHNFPGSSSRREMWDEKQKERDWERWGKREAEDRAVVGADLPSWHGFGSDVDREIHPGDRGNDFSSMRGPKPGETGRYSINYPGEYLGRIDRPLPFIGNSFDDLMESLAPGINESKNLRRFGTTDDSSDEPVWQPKPWTTSGPINYVPETEEWINNIWDETPTFHGIPFNEDTGFTNGEPMDIAYQLLKDRKSPEAWANKKRYDTQYEKNPKRVKYREQLNTERRRRGIYGKGGSDVSHTQGGKLTLEKPSSNRARHFKGKGTLRRVKVR